MLQQGAVILASVRDPQGANPKVRPLVVVTPTAELSTGAELVTVAITGCFSTPLQDDEVLLPFHPAGNAKSGLRKPCVAKCEWLVKLEQADVVDQKGFIPARELAAILNKIRDLDQAGAGK